MFSSGSAKTQVHFFFSLLTPWNEMREPPPHPHPEHPHPLSSQVCVPDERMFGQTMAQCSCPHGPAGSSTTWELSHSRPLPGERQVQWPHTISDQATDHEMKIVTAAQTSTSCDFKVDQKKKGTWCHFRVCMASQQCIKFKIYPLELKGPVLYRRTPFHVSETYPTR